MLPLYCQPTETHHGYVRIRNPWAHSSIIPGKEINRSQRNGNIVSRLIAQSSEPDIPEHIDGSTRGNVSLATHRLRLVVNGIVITRGLVVCTHGPHRRV